MPKSPDQTIAFLKEFLSKTPWIRVEERAQIQQRINQITRRKDDPRTFVAFIGEKKAGKTSLVRALTGVPLPVAVRECTAAICEIQVGLDWHHHAVLQPGEEESFAPISAGDQADALDEAMLNRNRLQKETRSRHQEAQLEFDKTQIAVIEKQKERQLCIDHRNQAMEDHRKALGSNPWVWSFLSLIAWLIPYLRRRLADIEESEQKKQAHENQLVILDKELETLKSEEVIWEKKCSTIWTEGQKQSQLAEEILEKAQKAYTEALEENEKKFQDELTALIDVKAQPAEHITIYTPNSYIPSHVVLLDTPGFNTDLESHRRRAWEAIEELADVCILVSDLRQPMPDTALNMLDRLEPFCPYMHVALTKTDLALAEAEELGEDPEEEVREAEEVARLRIKRHWDKEMNIWTVASINSQDQKLARSLFSDFWKQLIRHPDNRGCLKRTLATKEL